jgi:hypothetical protein
MKKAKEGKDVLSVCVQRWNTDICQSHFKKGKRALGRIWWG